MKNIIVVLKQTTYYILYHCIEEYRINNKYYILQLPYIFIILCQLIGEYSWYIASIVIIKVPNYCNPIYDKNLSDRNVRLSGAGKLRLQKVTVHKILQNSHSCLPSSALY